MVKREHLPIFREPAPDEHSQTQTGRMHRTAISQNQASPGITTKRPGRSFFICNMGVRLSNTHLESQHWGGGSRWMTVSSRTESPGQDYREKPCLEKHHHHHNKAATKANHSRCLKVYQPKLRRYAWQCPPAPEGANLLCSFLATKKKTQQLSQEEQDHQGSD